jgi:dipeptidyl aminopeptidase/acylaminoacyl peptidase
MRNRAVRLNVVGALAVAAVLSGSPPALAAGPGRIAYVSDRGNAGDIYMVTLDGSAPQRLTTTGEREEDPAVSPDGRTIAYTRVGELWLMNADGSGQRMLSGQYSHRPAWSPDGRTIAFWGIRAAHSGHGIYTIGADGSGLRRVTAAGDSRAATMPSYSPDGSTIVFQRDTFLTLIGSNGLGDRTVSTAFSGVIPDWSPDGSRIAFSIEVPEGSTEIHTVAPDGSGLQRLTDSPSGDIAPSWSPDGRQIAFGSQRDGNGELYVMNSDGSGVTRITHDPDGHGPYDGGPSWDPSSGSGPIPPPSSAPAPAAGTGGKLRLAVRGKRRQRLGRRGIAVVMRADPGTRVVARGTLRLPGKRAMRLEAARHVATSKQRVVLRLRLGPRKRALALAILREHGRPAVARLRVFASRADGAQRSIARRIVVLPSRR